MNNLNLSAVISIHNTVCPKERLPLKSSTSAACSNLNAFNSLMSPRVRKTSEQRNLMLALQINY